MPNRARTGLLASLLAVEAQEALAVAGERLVDRLVGGIEQIVAGTAPDDYKNPAEFFKRTCFTRALRDHTAMALRRLLGKTGNTSPVMALVTQFGGGKTHTLTTLYHLTGGRIGLDELRKIARASKPPHRVTWIVSFRREYRADWSDFFIPEQERGFYPPELSLRLFSPAQAEEVVSALVTEHADLKAVLCANDNMALGTVSAIKTAGKTDDILVVGFDNISAVQRLLKEGRILCTVDQHGDKLAIYGIEYALEMLGGKGIPSDKETPVDLITAETLQ